MSRLVLVAAFTATFASLSPARADEPPPAEAQAAYTSGRESFRAGLYGRALESFEQSIAIAPSPNTRLYIARTLRELGRLDEAAAQFRTTISEAETRGGKYAATKEAAEVELRDVEVRIARGQPAPATPPSAPSAPRATAEPNASSSAPARDETRSAGSRSAGPTALTWISGGVAVAGAASFGVLYALASDRYGYLEDRCTAIRTAACDDARKTGRTEETIGYVALGVGVIAATVAIVSWVVKPSPASSSSSRVRGPWLAF